jgi:PDZ domain-containing protein
MTEVQRREHRRRRIRALGGIFAATAAVTAVVLYVLFYIKLPYYIFGPGAAVDLNRIVIVPGHSPPPGALFLTDVDVLPGRPAYYAAAKILPGFEIKPRDELVPSSVSDTQLDAELVDDMKQSQEIAEVVAERAAGLHVASNPSVIIEEVLPKTPAASCFRARDRIVAVNGKRVANIGAVTQSSAGAPPGTRFSFGILRGKQLLSRACRTATIAGRPRFGMKVLFDPGLAVAPLPVRYDIHDINGSSAGLMFALQIYRTLTGRELAAADKIAGTGVLEYDGTVDPIEGTREKLQAAKRAGATIFVVPMQNYAEVKDVGGIRIVPVRSFADALRALRATS